MAAENILRAIPGECIAAAAKTLPDAGSGTEAVELEEKHEQRM
jgi:hypothetical protein